MRSDPLIRTARIGLPVVLVAGWLGGFMDQRGIVEATGYLDIPPELLVLGCVLCMAAGATVHVFATSHRRVRYGAAGGLAMLGAMVAGYLALVVAYRDRFPAGGGEETWWTLLLESWFWIGLPVMVASGLGALGWLVADLPGRLLNGQRGHGPMAHPR